MYRDHKLRWRVGVLAALGVTLLSVVPQTNFWLRRGPNWKGAFYSYHPDEYPYAAYVNTLILGRQRKNDPYTGVGSEPNASAPESIFSIQCLPAYAIALPARFIGISSVTAFILLVPICAFASGLIVFWLVSRVTEDYRIGAAAVPIVLCLGAFARGQLLATQFGYPQTPPMPFPFLRRYEPAFPFPFFFLFCLLVWFMLSTKNRRVAYRCALIGGLTFGVLVFSYYFVWTAAAALLLSLFVMWSVIRPEGHRLGLQSLSLLSGFALLTLLPYAALLSSHTRTIGEYQGLAFTHSPDLLRMPSLLCFAVLIAISLAAWRRIVTCSDRRVVFITALALAPLIMFNQQVITGRSLQPIHYEQFVANYLSLLALLLTCVVLLRVAWRGKGAAGRVLLISVTIVAIAGGIQEAKLAATSKVNIVIDDFMLVANKLSTLPKTAPNTNSYSTEVVAVLYPTFHPADALPTVAPQSVLWAPHMFVFSSLTQEENKERFFHQLYYSGIDPENQPEFSYQRIVFRQVIFGWDRAIGGLAANSTPITLLEEKAAFRDYSAFVETFDRRRAANPTLSYAIISARSPSDLTRIDRWYERDSGERLGEFILYRLKLRP